jgi:molybdate transport system substrate-binding protein
VAVAGNFAAPQAQLANRFESATGVRIETSIGSTGQLYAQIVNGAPFDVFLAADTVRPSRLEEEDLAVRGSRFTYAVGRLALYAPSWDSVRSADHELRNRDIRHLAIANPHTAPYGAAAIEVLQRLELENDYTERIVRGENVGQAFQFVESGAADAGFIALSQVFGRDPRVYQLVPAELHKPIRQDAVLLLYGQTNLHALEYLEFLRGEEGGRVITEFGYSIPEADR